MWLEPSLRSYRLSPPSWPWYWDWVDGHTGSPPGSRWVTPLRSGALGSSFAGRPWQRVLRVSRHRHASTLGDGTACYGHGGRHDHGSRPEEVALTEHATPTGSFSGRTAWSRSLQAPLRAFLQTESGSAGVLLLATVAALVWANLAAEAYVVVWETPLAIRVGEVGLTLTLREWVNSGLMTFFFFVVGWRPGGSSIWASCGSDVGSRFQCWRAWAA